jgi:phage-related minor tail protein
MADSNLYTDLKKALQDFKDFLHTNVQTIKPAIQALKSLIPQVGDLIDKLVGLMDQLKAEINKLDVSNIPGLSQVSTFTASIKTLLTTAENLLPDEKSAIDDVLKVVDVVSGLPSLDTVKQDILQLIEDIKTDLNSLK